jgi:hypothetical protein
MKLLTISFDDAKAHHDELDAMMERASRALNAFLEPHPKASFGMTPGCYGKRDFRVDWDDGTEYKGRYDL